MVSLIPGNFITSVKVLTCSTLADLRKLVEVYLGSNNRTFSFLVLGDPSGAPVPREMEVNTLASKISICNNQVNCHLACLRPVKPLITFLSALWKTNCQQSLLIIFLQALWASMVVLNHELFAQGPPLPDVVKLIPSHFSGRKKSCANDKTTARYCAASRGSTTAWKQLVLIRLRTTVFSHSQTVVVCGNWQSVLCQPTGL